MRIWGYRDGDLMGDLRDVYESTDFSLRWCPLRLTLLPNLLYDPVAVVVVFLPSSCVSSHCQFHIFRSFLDMVADCALLQIFTFDTKLILLLLDRIHLCWQRTRISHVRFLGAQPRPHWDNNLSLFAHILVKYVASIPV